MEVLKKCIDFYIHRSALVDAVTTDLQHIKLLKYVFFLNKILLYDDKMLKTNLHAMNPL